MDPCEADPFAKICGVDLFARIELQYFSAAPHNPIANMCNLYSITTNQPAIAALFRVVKRCL